MVRENMGQGVRRRQALKVTAGLGMVGVASGLGAAANNQEEYEISIGYFNEAPSLTLQRLAREHSDILDITAQETGGDPEAIRLIAQGETNAFDGHAFSWNQAYNDEGPFAERPLEPEQVPSQGFTYGSFIMYWLAREDTDLQTTDDVLENDDVNVHLFDPAFGLHQLWLSILGRAEHDGQTLIELLDDRTVPASAADAPGAVEEERIDALLVNSFSYRGLPGYTQELDAAGEYRALETVGAMREAMDAEPLVITEEVEPFGWDQDLERDEVFSVVLPNAFFFHHELAADEAVYELTRLAHEHGEEFYDTVPISDDISDIEVMNDFIADIPVHPGAAEYLQEQDAWDDEWTTTDEWDSEE